MNLPNCKLCGGLPQLKCNTFASGYYDTSYYYYQCSNCKIQTKMHMEDKKAAGLSWINQEYSKRVLK